MKTWTMMDELSEMFEIRRENVIVEPTVTISSKNAVREIISKKPKKPRNCKSIAAKRRSAENDSESGVSTSEKDPTPSSSKRTRKERGLINTYCPYCKERMLLNTMNLERHLEACYKKHEPTIKSESSVKRSARVSGKADRYSPDTYSERAYRYFKKTAN